MIDHGARNELGCIAGVCESFSEIDILHMRVGVPFVEAPEIVEDPLPYQ